jgi:cytochrome P450 PksS
VKRADPDDGLISALVAAEQAGDRLSPDELVGTVFLLLLAGHETTVNLIGNGVLALLDHPGELARLVADPGLAAGAVEEVLRLTNPVEHGVVRLAREDVELGGVVIPAGSRVIALLSSANHDETQFPEPERLDITREPNRHLAFGFGIHFCLGAPLARLEGTAAFAALARRFPAIALAVPRDQLRWRPANGFRGLRDLPVRLARPGR